MKNEAMKAENTVNSPARLSQDRTQLAWVVHEINKPATLICGGLDTLEDFLPTLVRIARSSAGSPAAEDSGLCEALERVHEILGLCRQGTGRLEGMLRQLGRVARKEPNHLEPRSLALAEVLENAVVWSANGSKDTTVHRDWPQNLFVDGDAVALTEALVNLVSNARDAVAGTPGARIEIEARPRLDPRSVEVRVRDNGPGVAHEDRERIFASFYTSKGVARGHGLGLAVARRIFAAHGGDLHLAAREPGSGAEFVVVLPRRANPN